MANAPKKFGTSNNRKRKDYRLPAHKRGYDRDWEKLALEYKEQNPICIKCDMIGITAPTEQVDHIIPFNGLNDPLRLDRKNLQPLCRSCHTKKTNKDYGR